MINRVVEMLMIVEQALLKPPSSEKLPKMQPKESSGRSSQGLKLALLFVCAAGLLAYVFTSFPPLSPSEWVSLCVISIGTRLILHRLESGSLDHFMT